MSKKIISIIIALAAACGGALAQYKQSGAMLPMNKHNTVLARKAIDTADLRILYAWGATDITQDSTYLDCGQLQIGKRMTKYCSLFVEQADDERIKWAKANPHPKGYPNGTWWMRGRKSDIWSEYQHSNIFIHGDTLNEWAVMPAGQEWPQRYEEKWTGQEWKLADETQTILGHPCQRATCRWRGRDYIAWFASDIPIRRGPWKFGGLPGLILKIYDVDSLYVFEAVAIGPGIGLHETTAIALISQIRRSQCPVVVDADGLNILANHRAWLQQLPKGIIMTPHPKEFDRLAGTPCGSDYERLHKAQELAQHLQAYILLKGHYSALCLPNGNIIFNSTGNSGMATAGSGDVLTGIITGLLARGYQRGDACMVGMYLHGVAGDLAAKDLGKESLIASDLITYLPKAFLRMRE